jgi:glycosyltransferase involved in cell wall biosynthesis
MRIAHVITSLQTGGAEKILYRNLRAEKQVRQKGTGRQAVSQAIVISLKDKGPVGESIDDLGVSVYPMEMHERPLRGLLCLFRTMDRFDPELVQTWLYHADLIGGLVARLQGRSVLWSIHSESPKSKRLKKTTRAVAYLSALGGRWIPDHVISCSKAAAETHSQFGYPGGKMSIIPNGFDVDKFRPNDERRIEVRNELNIPREAPVIGMVARFHPLKDHENFLEAAVHAQEEIPDLHFVLVGKNIRSDVSLFRKYKKNLEEGTLRLLGLRDDIPRLMPSFDVASLSSKTEAFPMVIGEAMACGVPCVATNVGDVSYLIGNTGIVVPPRDSGALAEAWCQILEMSSEEREALGRRARERVQEIFSQEAVLEQYQSIYERLVPAS